MVRAGAGGDGALREQSEAQAGAGRQRKGPVGLRTQQVSTFDPPKLKMSFILSMIMNDLWLFTTKGNLRCSPIKAVFDVWWGNV